MANYNSEHTGLQVDEATSTVLNNNCQVKYGHLIGNLADQADLQTELDNLRAYKLTYSNSALLLDGVPQTFAALRGYLYSNTRYVYVYYGDTIYLPVFCSSINIVFSNVLTQSSALGLVEISVDSSGVATVSSKLGELQSNKTTSITNYSTNTQYPGAKAVYDKFVEVNNALNTKENLSNKATSLLFSNVNDTKYPSTKAVDTKFVNNALIDGDSCYGKGSSVNVNTSVLGYNTDSVLVDERIISQVVKDNTLIYNSTAFEGKINGSLAVSEDGIATGFNYLNNIGPIPFNVVGKSFSLEFEYTLLQTENNAYTLWGGDNFHFKVTSDTVRWDGSQGIGTYSFNASDQYLCRAGHTHRLVAKWDNENSQTTLDIYIDGEFFDSITKNYTGSLLTSSINLYFGSRPDAGADSENFKKGSMNLKKIKITIDNEVVFNGAKVLEDTVYTKFPDPVIEGTLTETNGVYSGFSSGNYLTISGLTPQYVQPWVIKGKLVNITNGVKGIIFAENNPFLFKIIREENDGNDIFRLHIPFAGIETKPLDISDFPQLYFQIEFDGRYRYILKYKANKEDNWIYALNISGSGMGLLRFDRFCIPNTGSIIIGQGNSNDGYISCGFDINEFEIISGDDLIFKTPFTIPYMTQTKEGLKIVEGTYRDRVYAKYYLDKISPYYTVQEKPIFNCCIPSATLKGCIATNFGDMAVGNTIDFADSKYWEIHFRCHTGKTSGEGTLMTGTEGYVSAIYHGNSFLWVEYGTNGNFYFNVTNNGALSETNQRYFSADKDTDYDIILGQNRDYSMFLRYKKATETSWLEAYSSGSQSQSHIPNRIMGIDNFLFIGGMVDSTHLFKNALKSGSIDLSTLKVFLDGKLVYQAATSQSVTLPMGNMYTMNEFNKVVTNVDTSTGAYLQVYPGGMIEMGGSCTSGVPVVFDREFANTNYILTVPYSAKAEDGFTPSQTGEWIAKGLGAS